MTKDIFIVAAKRTPIGSFLGALSSLTAPQLGSSVVKGLLESSSVLSDSVSEVILGEVLTGGVGQAPARQAALGGGLPNSTPCMTINKVCGSGLKAIILSAQSIALGTSECVIAGGMESMSNAPFLVKGSRQGVAMGDQTMHDSMILDGLWDPYSNQHMGNCGELCALEKGFTREMQDNFAVQSYKRALEAKEKGFFDKEIVPVVIKGRKGKETVVSDDEEPGRVRFDKITTLRSVFQKDGTITAANASSLNDGAAGVIVASEDYMRRTQIKPIARIVAYSEYAHQPEWFTTAPIGAIEKVLDKARWNVDEVDLFEINEAFSVVALAAQKEFNIPDEKLNIWGGAVALGHPIGASGARLVVTLLSQMVAFNKTKGIVSLCIGGGEGIAMALELC